MNIYSFSFLDIFNFLSSTSGQFLTLMSGLDVNGMPEEHVSYVPHDDSNVTGIVKANSNEASMEFIAYSSHPSPTSTISPENSGSTHVQNVPSSTLPISRSSELAFALQTPDDQVLNFYCTNNANDSSLIQLKRMDEHHEEVIYATHPVTSPGVNQPQHQYYGVHDANNQPPATTVSLEYVDNCQYNSGSIASHEQLYEASTSRFHEGYSVDSHNNHFEYHTSISNVYGTYGGAVDPSIVSPLENGVHHVESFVPYA